MTEITNENTAAAPAVEEQLSLNDLYALVQIVDLASSRGAFRGNELSQVGAVHDRVARFLEITAQAQTPEGEDEDTVTEESA
jgi:hypothetical protein